MPPLASGRRWSDVPIGQQRSPPREGPVKMPILYSAACASIFAGLHKTAAKHAVNNSIANELLRERIVLIVQRLPRKA